MEERWHLLYKLAYKSKGVTIDLTRVPESVLSRFPEWHDQLVEEEDAAYEEMRRSKGQLF